MDKIRLTGLWKGTDREGNTFLSGNLNPITNLVVMPNTFKKGEKEPDYFVYLTPNEGKGKKQAKHSDL